MAVMGMVGMAYPFYYPPPYVYPQTVIVPTHHRFIHSNHRYNRRSPKPITGIIAQALKVILSIRKKLSGWLATDSAAAFWAITNKGKTC